MSGKYDRDEFEDPFAIGESDDLLDIPVTPIAAPPPPLLDGGRVTGGLSTSVTRGAGATLGPEAGSHLSSLDLAAALQASTIAGVLPTLQAQQRAGGLEAGKAEPHFLHHERRGLWGQAAYNIGYSYFGGLAVGGFVGFLSGLRKSPNNSPRVLLNSVLNGSGKFGARAGNAAGVLAMVYTVLERQFEDVEVDKLPGWVNNTLGVDVLGKRSRWDALIPATAAFATGALFTLPRAVTMRGIEAQYVSLPKRLAVMSLGGLATTAGVAALSVVGPFVFGHRSPFRFASS